MPGSGADGGGSTPVSGDAPLLQTVARNVPIVLFALDDEGVFTRSEGRGLARLGLEPNEVVGESAFDIYGEYPEIVDAVERALSGESLHKVVELGEAAFEVWYRPMGRDEIEGVLGVAIDVTDRIRHEQLLEQLNEATRELMVAGSDQEIAQRIVEINRRVLDEPASVVWLYDPDDGVLEPVAGTNTTRNSDSPASAFRDLDPIRPGTAEMDAFRRGEAAFFEDYGAVETAAHPGTELGAILAVPMGERGLLTVGAASAEDMGPSTPALVEILARDAAVALERAKRERGLEMLNRATQDLMRADTKEALVDRLVQTAGEVVGLPLSGVWLFDDESGTLRPAAYPESDALPEEPPEFGPGDSLAWQAFESGETGYYRDLDDAEGVYNPETRIESEIVVPIGHYGLLISGATSPDAFDEEDRDLVDILAATAVAAFERVERESILQQLHSATRALIEATSREEIARRTVEAAEEVLGHPQTVVRLLSEDGGSLEPVAMTDWIRQTIPNRPDFEIGEPPVGAVFERGEPRIFDRSDLEGPMSHQSTRLLLCLPIGDHGVLTIGELDPKAFDETDVQLAKILASNSEAAMDRIDREEELERQNERLDKFARIVSHDLRNPLNVISGNLALAREDPARFETIDSAVARMETIIDDVLDLARQGRAVDDAAPVDLSEAAARAWASVQTSGATVTIEDVPGIVADVDRLCRLLENLFRNAIDHGPEGVEVRLGAVEGGFYVEDDGPGIPPDQREEVFEMGYSTSDHGTGLGLAIVAEIVQAHGWTISLSEGADGGARFEITGVETA